jgi:hypothetical protein
MPKGGKKDRQAKHIIASEIAEGKSPVEAKGIAWAHIKHPPKKGKKS